MAGIRLPDCESRAVALAKRQVFPKALEVITGQLPFESFYCTVTPDKVAVMNHLGFPVNRDQFPWDVQGDCSCFLATNLNHSPCVKATPIELVKNNVQPFRRVAVNKARAMDRGGPAFVLEVVLDRNPSDAMVAGNPMQGLGPFAAASTQAICQSLFTVLQRWHYSYSSTV